MHLQIVNANDKYGRIKLSEPTTLGYIHIAAQTGDPSFPFRANTDAELLSGLKELASHLEQLDAIETVTVFKAVGLPPVERLPYVRERADSIHVAQFDVVILIETKSPESIEQIQATHLYQVLVENLSQKAKDVHVMTARNSKRVGNVDKTRDGLFLFNYFVADDVNTMMELWDYLADWYRVEMGLNNSILLIPIHPETSDFLAINHARFDLGLPGFLAKQMSKKSFRDYMLANLEANHVGAMPILYRLA
ncbi:hypothetical protein [Alicyclobacillus kakegawensis]|uniref:hypothetical protein n=1 Tax=Alicyclobacillus kakegawensis TaxID=392012 RepID=UPI00082A3BEC|nr:hypothetical protein [Alicyclobacillus kakegawensis]